MGDLDVSTVGIIAAAIGLGALVFVMNRRAQQRRREAYQALVSQHGWNYADEDPAFVNRWDGDPFASGYGRRARNVVSGVYRGQQFAAFEHVHKTRRRSGSNHTTQSHWHFVCALRLPVFLPRLEVKKRGFGSFVADWFGMQDIEVGHEEFDKRYRIKSDDERFARDLLQSAVVEHILSNDLDDIRIAGADLLAWESGRPEPTIVSRRLDRLVDFVERISATVWTVYGRT